MVFGLDNWILLAGLSALGIPLLLHLLQRRRFEILDWGAMQFLPESFASQRRRWLDEILLMLLRMGMIALFVIALAAPSVTSTWLPPLSDTSSRDIVLVLDGSYSMDLRLPDQFSPWQEAIRWARTQVEGASPSDRFAIVIARHPPLFWLEEFSGDRDEVQSKLQDAPGANGNPNIPLALAAAWKHLQTNSRAAVKEIVVLTDQQHFGWSDPATLSALETLGDQWHQDAERARQEGLALPSLRLVKIGAQLPDVLPNDSLAPLIASHRIVQPGQKISFQSALHREGFKKMVPSRPLTISVDGQPVQKLSLPDPIELKQGQVPLKFQHQFNREGQHLVSLALEVDPTQDVLTADNVQHVLIDVVKELPILIVEGEQQLSSTSSSFFLQRALASKDGPIPGTVVIPGPTLQTTAIMPDSANAVRPVVIVMADVPRLTAAHLEAMDQFLSEGGGLLIVTGERVAQEKEFYNEQLYLQGQGWLPAPLLEVATSKDGVQPEPRTFQHPALEIFRTTPDGSMSQVRFSHWWKVKPGARDQANPIAMLSNGDPMLIEKAYKKGRVILCTVPLDRRWNSNFPGVWEYPIFVHELVQYLAGNQTDATTLRDGAPLRLMGNSSAIQRLTLKTPERVEKTVEVKSWPWVYENTGTIGTYHVNSPEGKSWSFIVPADLRESNLTRCSEEDLRKIRDRLPVAWHAESATDTSALPGQTHREELWWLLLVAVISLLCMEVWMTRRMVRTREP